MSNRAWLKRSDGTVKPGVTSLKSVLPGGSSSASRGPSTAQASQHISVLLLTLAHWRGNTNMQATTL